MTRLQLPNCGQKAALQQPKPFKSHPCLRRKTVICPAAALAPPPTPPGLPASQIVPRPSASVKLPITSLTSPGPGPVILDGQVLHSLDNYQLELVNSLAPFVESDVLPILKDPTTMWQPADLLPEPASPTFMDEVRELRERADTLSDEYFVVLVGDMISEEALPTYMAMLNTLDGVRDETGASQTPWGRWTRSWVAEENRHGDVLNKYCFLSGRVDFKAVGVTIQNLIRHGMEPKTENNPYKGFIYTTFQERATKVSHGATARQALGYGDRNLAKICAHIAGDESRHEKAYSKIIEELFRLDPSGAMLAFSDMMHKQIVMPAHLLNDGQHSHNTSGRNLFKDYSSVAQAIGVYTSQDYVDIFEHLVKVWKVQSRTGMSVEAQQAQEGVCTLLQRFKRLTERQAAAAKRKSRVTVPFSWVYGREVSVAQ